MNESAAIRSPSEISGCYLFCQGMDYQQPQDLSTAFVISPDVEQKMIGGEKTKVEYAIVCLYLSPAKIKESALIKAEVKRKSERK